MTVENRLVIPSADQPDRMMRWLSTAHLPPELVSIVAEYRHLGELICREIAAGPERTVALRKLVESKDCAVRAVIEGMPAK